MKCNQCGKLAGFYVNVIYELDDRWVDVGTNHADDYTCQQHIARYIDTFDVEGAKIIEAEVKTLAHRE